MGAALEASALGVSGAPRLWARPPGTKEEPLSTTPPNSDRAAGTPGGPCTLPTSRPQPCSRTLPKPQARTDPEAGAGGAGPRATPKPGMAATPLLGLSPPEWGGGVLPLPPSLTHSTNLSESALCPANPKRSSPSADCPNGGEPGSRGVRERGRRRTRAGRDVWARLGLVTQEYAQRHTRATRRNTATKLLP